ncbi:MAG: penicillin-binding protein, partial [Solirubrobacteraceae bacterium]|nr:penicillin-binding protein [Solirubrobacteraceae bacterium]
MRPRPRLKKLRLLLIVGGLSAIALLSTAFGMMMAVAADLPDIENRAEFQRARNSVLYDRNGVPMGELTSNTGRVILKPDEISLSMQHAIVAIEDRRFYQNSGVDLKGIGRALFQDVVERRAVQGGSTIAQQFVKTALAAQDQRTVFQKAREAALAFHLTRKWSKEKILTEYLNSIYFGNGAYGIESAARTYFGIQHDECGTGGRRCASELTPAESALLAGVVSSPSMYDPVANPEAAKRRRDLVLQRMLEQGYLTRDEYTRGIDEALPAKTDIRPPSVRAANPRAAYFVSWVRQQIADRYGARRAFEGGLRISTTLDVKLQAMAEQAVNTWLSAPGGPQASLVAIDNATGEVRAMVGGEDFATRPFNLATQGQRQPGSAFKPFVLATAINRGISPSSVWSSKKLVVTVPGTNGREKYTVNNYEDSYLGSASLAAATAASDNAVYVQVGMKAGLKRVATTAKELGIRTPVSSNPAMALGGLNPGVTPLDMAHAYSSLAAGGLRVTGTLGTAKDGPVGIRKVAKRDDKEDVLDANKRKRTRVLPASVAAETTNVLHSVLTTGTARTANLGASVPQWGKTGTTENYGDAWFVGSSGSLTVAVWVGYPDRLKPMETEWRGEPVSGGTYPAAIWKQFMLGVMDANKAKLMKACEDEEAKKTEKCKEAGLGEAPATTTPAPSTGTTTTPGGGTAPDTTTTPDGSSPGGIAPTTTTPTPPAATTPQAPATPAP